MIAAHAGERVAVITHGPVIMSYLAQLAGTTSDFFFNPKLTSISRVLARGETRTIDFVNARPHFGGF
jgi:hypothetical protein